MVMIVVSNRLQLQSRDRRETMSPIPINLREFLSDDQRRSLRQIEGFGWSLSFVRRPLAAEPVVVIQNGGDAKLSVLESDGTVNDQPDIALRV